MTDLNTTEVHSRAITAFFETEAAAKKAVADLENEGIPSRHIALVAGGASTAASTTDASSGDTGFMASLKSLFLPDEDRYAYAEGLRRGGYLLSVDTDEANYNRVLDILDVDGSVDMNERETAWKAEGWKGYEASAPLAAGTVSGATAYQAETVANAPAELSSRSTTAPALTNAGQEESIALVEERLKVGKRDVSHGRVRLRSYVIETPVTEQVSLHSETVQVDRKPVDRPVSATDALFQDRVIEVEETAEEAVIAKTAHVTEEISLHKATEDRVQTVSDTVRHTEVEVDDSRGKDTASAGKFVAADATRIVPYMDVIASDGTKIGTVDHMEGTDKIKLTKQSTADAQHHHVPLSWVDHVDQHIHLNKTTAEAKAGW